MNNTVGIFFPEDGNKDSNEQELRHAFEMDVDVPLPDGITGKVSGVKAGDIYEGPSKGASIEDLMKAGIPLEAVKKEGGEQAFTNQEITSIYSKNRPAFINLNYLDEEVLCPSFRSLREDSAENIALSKIPSSKVPAPALPLNKSLSDIVRSVPASKGIVPPEPVQENPFIITNTDNDAAIIIKNVAKRVPMRHHIRYFEEKHYFYDYTLRYYRVLTMQALRFLIDAEPEIQEIKFKNPGIHSKVSTLIFNDSSLRLDRTQSIDLIPEVWVFKNSIVNILTDEVWANDGTFFCRHAISAYYDPSADCPFFKAFIKSIANNSAEIETELWQVIGYLLSTDTRAKKFFLFFGERDCGKSVLGQVLAELIGTENVSYLSPHNFADRFASSETVDKLLLTCMDLPAVEISDKSIGVLKQITGRDGLYSERKNKDAVSRRPVSKILLGSNFPLKLSSSDEALMSRLITVPFTHRIRPEDQDHHLKEKLLQEASGICNTAIAYYRALITSNYEFQHIYVDMPAAVIDHQALLEAFIRQNVVFTTRYEDSITVEELFSLFTLFCTKKGVYNPLDKAAFSRKFRMQHDYNESEYPGNVIPPGCVWKGKININGKSLQGFRGIRITET